MDIEQKKRRLLELLHRFSFEKKEVTLASGQKSNFYVDCRQTILQAEAHYLIGEIFAQLINNEFPQAKAVGGVVLGAAPIASAASLISYSKPGISTLDAFYLRKQAKGHGNKKLMEGNIPVDTPVVIVEDVVTTGGSTIKALKTALNENLNVLGVIALVDREENNGAARIAQQTHFVSLFTKSDFFNFEN
ncbi:MAG: orotate phosphoribosyltransferase [Myxococcota bacterium]